MKRTKYSSRSNFRSVVIGNGMRYSYPYDSIGGIRNVYDGAGRIVSQNFGDRIERKYCYDTDGSFKTSETTSRMYRFMPGLQVPFRSGDAFEELPVVTLVADPFNDINSKLKRTIVSADTLERYPSGRISTRRGGGTEQSYVYDVYGRLVTASAHQASDPGASYSSEYEYDSNGNIIEASYHGVTDRVGEALIYGEKSRLSYKHSGNRTTGIESEYLGETYEGVSGIAETGTFELSYDSRGNVISDESCGISSAVYNHLNQPVEVRTSAESIKFTYDNTGELLSREYNDSESGILRKQEFMGPYELCGDSLAAVHFDGGYFDSRGKVYYHITDYQGNVSSVMCGNGLVVQKASYYPYGEPWLEPEGDNRRLYSGKERLNFGSLRHSDYGPRLLDTRSGRWNSQDPHMESYFDLSPYSVCGSDPINYVNRDGKDITLIMSGIHIAMLIGNDTDGWRYFSMNGIPIYNVTFGAFGGSYKHNLGDHSFKTVQDFLNSSFNTEGTTDQRDNGEVSGFNYTTAYSIESTEEQDIKAEESFCETAKIDYNFFTNNCGDAVSGALRAAGFTDFSNINNDVYNKLYDFSDIIQSYKRYSVLGFAMKYWLYKLDRFPTTVPALVYKNFKQRYPNGKAYE